MIDNIEYACLGQNVTEEEVEELLQRPAIDIFNQNILRETQEAKQKLLDVQERHEEVRKIEESILTVNQLFQVCKSYYYISSIWFLNENIFLGIGNASKNSRRESRYD